MLRSTLAAPHVLQRPRRGISDAPYPYLSWAFSGGWWYSCAPGRYVLPRACGRGVLADVGVPMNQLSVQRALMHAEVEVLNDD